jgi:hypothetical protein
VIVGIGAPLVKRPEFFSVYSLSAVMLDSGYSSAVAMMQAVQLLSRGQRQLIVQRGVRVEADTPASVHSPSSDSTLSFRYQGGFIMRTRSRTLILCGAVLTLLLGVQLGTASAQAAPPLLSIDPAHRVTSGPIFKPGERIAF